MATIDLETLPDDAEILKALVRELVNGLKDRDRLIEQLKFYVERLRRHQFGRRSEKLDPRQLALVFAEIVAQVVAEEDKEEAKAAEEEASPRRRKKKGHGRGKLPANLLVNRIEHPVPESEKQCKGCGDELARIGEDVSRQLEYEPASFFIIENVRPKLACKRCQENVVVAPLPPQPIDKGLPGSGLLAHVITSKYADHLPLNRLEGIFQRHGIELSRSTLCGWVASAVVTLGPLYDAMKADVLLSKYLNADDTPVPVLDKTLHRTRRGRLWVYIGDRGHPHVVFDYTPDWTNDGALAFLEGFSGNLQADAYKGWDEVYAKGTVCEIACMAHARRGFYDARTSDVLPAHTALAFIGKLYDVEREAKNLTADERKAMRQERSRPIMEQFKTWLDGELPKSLPKSPIGQAIGYALNQWPALLRYLDDGDLAIDNNAAERQLRRVAVGRKNWMFAGSDAGGERAAVIYSFVATCQAHGVDPFEYLRDVLQRLPAYPAEDLTSLLPASWQAAREQVARTA